MVRDRRSAVALDCSLGFRACGARAVVLLEGVRGERELLGVATGSSIDVLLVFELVPWSVSVGRVDDRARQVEACRDP